MKETSRRDIFAAVAPAGAAAAIIGVTAIKANAAQSVQSLTTAISSFVPGTGGFTAVPGAGNLLGNLLCDIANLLNSGGPLSNLLTQLTNLLNQVLGAL